MVQLDGEWDEARKPSCIHNLALTWEHKEAWSVYQIQFSEKEGDHLSPPFKKIRRIEYASPIWKLLFCSDIDKEQYARQLRDSE